VVPFKLFTGAVPEVVVVFTDLMVSVGGSSGGSPAIGPKEEVTASMDMVGVLMAGEFGSCTLSML
jgi:hypothetical protein